MSPLSAALLVLFVVGAYGAVVYLPAWWTSRQVVGAFHEAASQAWKEPSDEVLRALIASRADRLLADEAKLTPAPILPPGSIRIVRAANEIRISAGYTIPVALPLTGRTHAFHFQAEAHENLSPPSAK